MGNPNFRREFNEALHSFGENHLIAKFECEICKEVGIITHREGAYPDFCPHCGLDGNGAPGNTGAQQ